MATILLPRSVLLAATVAATLASHAPAHDAGAQAKRRGAIYFQVVDTAVNPLAGAEIVLPHLGLAMQLAEEAAMILVDVPDGMYVVQARHAGYKTEWRVVRVSGDTARARFTMMPAAPALDTAAIAGDAATLETRLQQFVRRSTTSPAGYFITREDVERRRPSDVGALLQTVGGVVVERAPPGPTFVRSRRSGGVPCSAGMLVFVDGALLNPPSAFGGTRQRTAREDSLARRPRPGSTAAGSGTGGRGSRSTGPRGGTPALGGAPLPTVDPSSAATTGSGFDVNRVPLATVAGVEVYPTLAGVPPEFRLPGAECGVVLVWTAG